jgi:hypothetical protein
MGRLLNATQQLAADVATHLPRTKQVALAAGAAGLVSFGVMLFKQAKEATSYPRETLLRQDLTVSHFRSVPNIAVEQDYEEAKESFKPMISKTCISPANVSTDFSGVIAPVRFLDEQIIVGNVRDDAISPNNSTQDKASPQLVGKKRTYEDYMIDNYSQADLVAADEELLLFEQPLVQEKQGLAEDYVPGEVVDAINDLKADVQEFAKSILPSVILNLGAKDQAADLTTPVLHGKPSSPVAVKAMMARAANGSGKVACLLPKSKQNELKKTRKWVLQAAKSLNVEVLFV